MRHQKSAGKTRRVRRALNHLNASERRGETSDFERRLQLVQADHFSQPGEATDMYGAGPNGYHYNP